MKRIAAVISAGLALSTPAFAEGDAAAGEKEFKKCKSCHMVQDDAGEAIVKGGKTGPNLYGVAGRTAGTAADFKYSNSLVEAGEAGLAWDEASFVAYVQDPSGFLKTQLNDTAAKGKMSFKLKDEEAAANIFAYLVSVGPGS